MNTDATCSIVTCSGTVTARRFIDLPAEKDRMYGILERIKRSQSHGNRGNGKLWRFVGNYGDAVAIHAAAEIVEFALEYNAKVVVFEHLEGMKPKGGKKQRLALWRKKEIVRRATDLAHRYGLRASTVCPYGTSRLAYDGSGPVERGIGGNWSLCRFSTGKEYNCDLSASYNICARYFVREYVRRLPATAAAGLRAKVPEAFKRTLCTLSTLISLYAVISSTGFMAEYGAVFVEGKSASP